MIVPLYIQETRRRNESIVLVRPLFFDEPERSAELLSRAMARFSQDIRKHVETLLQHDRHDGLTQFSFAPETASLPFDETLTLRRQTLRCRFLVVSFRALDRRLGFSPSVPDVWFDIAKGERVRDRAVEAYTDHFRALEREWEDDGSGPLPPPAADYIRGWISHVDFDVSLYRAVKKPPADKFASLFAPAKMDGRAELDKVGRRLESLYPDDLDRAVLREKEVEDLAHRLRDPQRRPLLLVGPRQVGKTALVHECVFRRIQADPRQFQHRNDIWLLSPGRLISGMMYAGQWESRLLAILQTSKERDHILYFDDLPGLLLAGVSSSSDLNIAQVLRPYLERREVRFLGEITPEVLRALQERDRGFAEQFEIVRIAEPSEDEARRIMIAAARALEGRHRCTFDLDVLPTLWDLQRRYARDQALPGKVTGLLRRLAAKFPNVQVTRDVLLEEYHHRSGLARGLLDRRRKLERRTVVDALAAQVAGQADALSAMADAVSIAKAQLNDPTRPLATFLFLGPTGVGKTETARALAEFLFDDEAAMVRIDMSEYMEKHAVARLIGAPPGYVGYDEGGQLTEAVRRRPYSVVLFDEIEKAHPDVFNVLLQVLDDGRLTDSKGRTVDFKNTVLIMTSNLGASQLATAWAEGEEGFQEASDRVMGVLREHFRPEFLNRIDDVVVFHPLGEEQLTHIIDLRLADLEKLLADRKITIELTPAARKAIFKSGYDRAYGARPLKRAIQRLVQDPLATRILDGTVRHGDHVVVDAGKQGLTFDVTEPAHTTR